MIPVVVLATVDPVLRSAAEFSLLTDLPGTGMLRQDLDPVAWTLRRVLGDEGGVIEDVTRPAEEGCPGCVIREDALPALEAMAAAGRWQRILFALPVTAAAMPAARPLVDPVLRRRTGVELATVVSVVDADRVEADLMGAERLADRGLALTPGDQRSVGEALAGHLAHADLVLTTGSDPTGLALIDHLRSRRTGRSDLFDTRVRELFAARHSPDRAGARMDPRLLEPGDVPEAHGVWTLDLCSRRPVHPTRFLHRLPDLAGGRIRTRGRFHLPTRPGRMGVLDGTGGHLAIGDGGSWHGCPPSTRLVLTGVGDGRAQRERAFADILLTDAELAADGDWTRIDDGMDGWLGVR